MEAGMDYTLFARDENSEAADVLIDMRRIMITLLGVIFTLLAVVVVLLFSFKPRFGVVLRWVMLFLCGWQIAICLFFWFNPVWPITFQLMVFAMFGIFAFVTGGTDHILVFLLLTFFDFFVVIGKMTWLGYPASDLLDAMSATDCIAYYNHSTSQCAGYLSFLRFLAFWLILAQPVQLFFTYLVYKLRKEDANEPLQNDYGKISDPSPSSSQPEAH